MDTTDTQILEKNPSPSELAAQRPYLEAEGKGVTFAVVSILSACVAAISSAFGVATAAMWQLRKDKSQRLPLGELLKTNKLLLATTAAAGSAVGGWLGGTELAGAEADRKKTLAYVERLEKENANLRGILHVERLTAQQEKQIQQQIAGKSVQK